MEKQKSMTRPQYQAHFIASYGAQWDSMKDEKKAYWWDKRMKIRKEKGCDVWKNPWRYDEN